MASTPPTSSTSLITSTASTLDLDALCIQFAAWSAESASCAAVAAVRALLEVIKKSEATTMMGLQKELQALAALLKQRNPDASLSLTSGSELFTRFVTRTSLDVSDFETCKKLVLQRGENFLSMTSMSRGRISEFGTRFIRDGVRVMTLGYSRVVLAVLSHAAALHRRFSVIVPESRPDNAGPRAAKVLAEMGIPVTLISDSAIASVMEQCDLVLVGAEGVVENGGIINKIGTYQLSLVAAALNRPFYVAAESFKFTRLYPLGQRDEGLRSKLQYAPAESLTHGEEFPPSVKVETPLLDYTPPKYITLILTDLGILTPSAVSDELIRLYL